MMEQADDPVREAAQAQPAPTAAPQNQHGQTIKNKGRATRARIVETVTTLLQSTRLRDLRVADIARRSRVSPAGFYVYFKDVPDVVLAALELIEPPPVLAEGADIASRDGFEAAVRAFIHLYFSYWDTHRTLFRSRNLAAEEGDDRFRLLRERAVRPVIAQLSRLVANGQQAGRIAPGVHPASAASALVAMLERLAAVAHTPAVDVSITRARTIDAAAYLFVAGLSPGSGDSDR